jgi:hypothetical protein
MAAPVKGGGEVLFTSMRLYHNKVKNIKTAKGSDLYMDLLSVYTALNIYESIKQPFQTAELSITDSNDMIADYPVMGGEIVHISYNVSGGTDDTKISKWFRVANIQGPIIQERKQYFTISLITEEGYNNIQSSISQSFTGAPHDIVRDIFQNYIFSKDTKEGIYYDMSIGSMKFVPPRWRPAKAIQWVSNKAVDPDTDMPGFFFFQSMHGFKFLSTSTMFSETKNVVITNSMEEIPSDRKNGAIKSGYLYKVPGVPSYGADGKPISGMMASESAQNVDDFRIDERSNYLSDLNGGTLAAKHITHDSFHKSYSVQTYDYFNSYDPKSKKFGSKLKRLSPNPKYVDWGESLNSDTKILLSSRASRLHSERKGETGYRDLFANDYLLGRTIVMSQLDDEVLSSFQVPGHPVITVGRLAYFNFPSIKKVDKPVKVYQPKYSGMYLFRDAIHIFKPVGNSTASYKCDAIIVKDGWNA